MKQDNNKIPPVGLTFQNVTMSVNADQAVRCWTQDQTLGKRTNFTPTVSVQGYAQFTSTGMMCGFNPTRKGAHGSPYHSETTLPSGARLESTKTRFHVRGMNMPLDISMPEFRQTLLNDMVALYRWSYEQENRSEFNNIINNIQNDLQKCKYL